MQGNIYAHIENGVVVNKIIWDGVSELEYSNKLILSSSSAIGDSYEDGLFYYFNEDMVKIKRD